MDKIDTCGFLLIDENLQVQSFLRRSAIGLLRIIIENKLNFKLRDLINYSIKLYEHQGVQIKIDKVELQVLSFIKDRMRNILKQRKIRADIIEASVSSHAGDNFLDLYKKTILMNKHIKREVGMNAVNSYKRAANILDKENKSISGRPDAVLFRKIEEKQLYEKINEIRKAFTVKDSNKNYEDLLIKLSQTKDSTDNFFDKVVVNEKIKILK